MPRPRTHSRRASAPDPVTFGMDLTALEKNSTSARTLSTLIDDCDNMSWGEMSIDTMLTDMTGSKNHHNKSNSNLDGSHTRHSRRHDNLESSCHDSHSSWGELDFASVFEETPTPANCSTTTASTSATSTASATQPAPQPMSQLERHFDKQRRRSSKKDKRNSIGQASRSSNQRERRRSSRRSSTNGGGGSKRKSSTRSCTGSSTSVPMNDISELSCNTSRRRDSNQNDEESLEASLQRLRMR